MKISILGDAGKPFKSVNLNSVQKFWDTVNLITKQTFKNKYLYKKSVWSRSKIGPIEEKSQANLWAKILLACVWWQKAIRNKQKGKKKNWNEKQSVVGGAFSLPFSFFASSESFYDSPPEIIPITELILVSSVCVWVWVCVFFTLPVDRKRGLIQAGRGWTK